MSIATEGMLEVGVIQLNEEVFRVPRMQADEQNTFGE